VPDICAGPFDPAAKRAALDECLAYCVQRRAMLIVDPFPEWTSVPIAVTDTVQNPLVTGPVENAAVYFPWISVTDQVTGAPVHHPPSGAVAGVWGRTDVSRGVWKAPAGLDDGVLTGVADLDLQLTDATIGELNPLGVNCLRRLPLRGPVVWGARTVEGADALASQWKYVPIRRLALYIEESLYRGTRWVVFEPNDEPLWSQIRLNVGTFMDRLFRQGAFQGASRKEAYLVKCDADNNPQADIDLGIVNIVVGFAPLKPAEFVLIHIQQMSSLTTA
jgi:phage tail sheath protein FI